LKRIFTLIIQNGNSRDFIENIFFKNQVLKLES
jgi:hypothetical protein